MSQMGEVLEVENPMEEGNIIRTFIFLLVNISELSLELEFLFFFLGNELEFVYITNFGRPKLGSTWARPKSNCAVGYCKGVYWDEGTYIDYELSKPNDESK